MLRKCTDEDISDEEWEKVIDPFYENYDSYLEEYVISEVIAFYIASSFYRNAMWEATFKSLILSRFFNKNESFRSLQVERTFVHFKNSLFVPNPYFISASRFWPFLAFSFLRPKMVPKSNKIVIFWYLKIRLI